MSQLEKRLFVLEPLYRLKIAELERVVNIWVIVDTSGSMFDHIGSALGLDLDSAVEFALSAAFSIITKMLYMSGRLRGFLGFFSDKTSNFIYGGDISDLPKGGRQGDYYSLEGATPSLLEVVLQEGLIRISVPTGGTDPNPLLKHLAQVQEREYGRKPNFIFIITDGYTPTIYAPEADKVIVVIVPGGQRPEVKSESPVSFVELAGKRI